MGYERFIFWFWESPTTGWHACKVKKHFHCLIICIYFDLNCSTTPKRFAQQLIFQTPPLRDANLRWLVDWSHFYFIVPVMPDKAAFVSAVLLCVQRYRGNLFLPLQKWHLVAKNEFAFSFRPTEKTNKWAGNILMFHVDVNMKRLGIHFKNDSFQWFRVDSFFWETINLYTVHFQI